MPTSEEIERRLLERRLNEWMIKPDYEGYSLANLVSNVLRCFGYKSLRHMPIPEASLDECLDGVENLILLLIDGLSYYQAKGFVAKYLKSFNPLLIPLTSTFPSTTTTALTTLNTGLTPIEHGIIGYTMHLKEIGVVLSLTNFAPSAAPESTSLLQAGLDPSSFLNAESVHTKVKRSAARPIIMTRRLYRESPFTTMLGSEAEIETYVNASDLFIRLRKIVEQSKDRLFVFPYWDGFDISAHIYGPESEEAEAELETFFSSLKSNLIDKMCPSAAKKTAMLALSDHGQVTLAADEVLMVSDHPTLLNALHIPPTGDSRAACLYIKPDMREEIFRYVEQHLANLFVIYDVRTLINEGIFGLGEAKPNLFDRTGDLILLPKRSGAVAYNYRPKSRGFELKGGHGGLHPREVIVPLFCLNLGKVG
ncbi:MAG: alkaline phosphatase family protein [Thaumarchaeota archaeon]|nr:alkaline phosphatase family protein [Nitrososphaerota archaeon]